MNPVTPVGSFFYQQVLTFIRSYGALARVSWSELLQYRASVFLWTLWSLAGPIIHLSVWRSIVQVEGSLGGYDQREIVTYFVVQSVVYHFTVAWQVYEFSYLIRTGRLSARLLRPFDPSHYIVAQNAAFKVINLLWLLPIWTGMYLYFQAEIEFSFNRIITFSAALCLAGILHFLWVHCWAMVAFWTVRADSFFDLFETLSFLLGGGIAPVALLPGVLQEAARLLPFFYMVGLPIEVATGAITPADMRPHLVMAVAWVAVFFTIYRTLWRRGLKRYGAVGA